MDNCNFVIRPAVSLKLLFFFKFVFHRTRTISCLLGLCLQMEESLVLCGGFSSWDGYICIENPGVLFILFTTLFWRDLRSYCFYWSFLELLIMISEIQKCKNFTYLGSWMNYVCLEQRPLETSLRSVFLSVCQDYFLSAFP
jgi:hypothetical protein